jgi:hypothetical protein
MIDPNSDHKTYMARLQAAAQLLETGNKQQCIEECQNTLRYDVAATHWLECNRPRLTPLGILTCLHGSS